MRRKNPNELVTVFKTTLSFGFLEYCIANWMGLNLQELIRIAFQNWLERGAELRLETKITKRSHPFYMKRFYDTSIRFSYKDKDDFLRAKDMVSGRGKGSQILISSMLDIMLEQLDIRPNRFEWIVDPPGSGPFWAKYDAQ